MCNHLLSSKQSMQSQPYRWLLACRLPAIQPSSILLKSRQTSIRQKQILIYRSQHLLLTPVPRFWWRMTGSNRRPPACKAGALPAELIPRDPSHQTLESLVGLVGLEPTTPALSTQCSNQLSYRPIPIPRPSRIASISARPWLVPTTDKCGRSILSSVFPERR